MRYLGQHVNSALVNYSEVIDQINDGKLRALATTSAKRISAVAGRPCGR